MNDAVKTQLTASDVFARSATELENCVRLMRRIEEQLLPVVVVASSQTGGLAANDALQDIDLLVQMLEDMAVLLTFLAGSEGAETVLQAHYSLSRMRLFDLRQRIAGAKVAEAAPAQRISLF